MQTSPLPTSSIKKLGDCQVKVQNKSTIVSDQALFFINIDRSPKKRVITLVPYGNFMTKHLCVSAPKDSILLEALKIDGRFDSPENWELHTSKENLLVNVNTLVSDCENSVFDVHRKKYPNVTRKRKAPSSESVSKSDAVRIKEEKIEDLNANVPWLSPSTPIQTKGVSLENTRNYDKVLEYAKKQANKLLVGKPNKRLGNLIEEKFSKPVDQSKGVWLMEELVSSSKSVGHIFAEPGMFFGTCFLIKDDLILTNYHVYEAILHYIGPCAVQNNRKVKVWFNHVLQVQTSDPAEFEVDMKDSSYHSNEKSLDYIFLPIKGKCNLPGLGKKISVAKANNFSNGVVTIIGHPGGREKHMDTDCRIIPQFSWRPEFLNRMQCLSQQVDGREPEALFMCQMKEDILQDSYSTKIAYDTSFFHGASGSPVFDDQGQIIAMHSSGWVQKWAENKYYIMEFAIPLAVILHHCYDEFPEFAKSLPISWPMDVDNQNER